VLKINNFVLCLPPATLPWWRLYSFGRQGGSCGAASCVQAWPPQQENSGCQGKARQITGWNPAAYSA